MKKKPNYIAVYLIQKSFLFRQMMIVPAEPIVFTLVNLL